MVTITTAMVARIRQLRAEGLSQRSVAAIVGVSYRSVEKYETPEAEARQRAREHERYDRERQNPQTLARKRAAASAWYYRNRNT